MTVISRTRALAGGPLGPDADAIVAAALAAVDPAAWVRRQVGLAQDGVRIGPTFVRLPGAARVWSFAIGKAARPTTRALVEQLGPRLAGAFAVVPDTELDDEPIASAEILAGGHPLPTSASLAAGRRLLDVVGRVPATDLAVFAISGGASSLACVPIEPVSIADLRGATDRLARAGVDIATLNGVRGRLDRLKHGGLRRACTAEHAVALVLVDVPDGDPRAVGSGPTATPERDAPRRAFEELRDRGLLDVLPERCRRLLATWSAPPPQPFCDTIVVADNATAVAAARAQAQRRGYALVDGDALIGDAREVGTRLGRHLHELAAQRPSACIVGGEPTTVVRGPGRGGRTLELAWAVAEAIAGLPDVAFVAIATDGRDGNSDAAGAVVDGTTLARARAAGLDVAGALAQSDTAGLFETLGDLVPATATGTNVCDVAVLLAR